MTVRVGDRLTLEDVCAVAEGSAVEIAPGVPPGLAAARAIVEKSVASGQAVYGISTGIGHLATVRIPTREATALQRDVVRSHAAAVGDPLPVEVVRAMLLLKARTFAFGISGVRRDLVERIVTLLNLGIHPVVPSQGSLGASGDLALLAHLALPLLGEGEVERGGVVMPARDALRKEAIEPLELSHKEGLSLVNGTEAMLALGILSLRRAERLSVAADVTAAMSVEALLGTDRAFDDDIVSLRAHPGARVVAANLRALLAASAIVASHRESEHLVQDAYSLRCIPQVHGAYRDALSYVRTTLERELESAIDNPSVLVERGEVLSGGNFHGEALGLAMDHLALAVTGYATIAERRVARIVDPSLNNGLPAFLTDDPGRRSGFMIVHYTAAALVAEARSLCFPASSDSIPTSAGQEDHVSMGAAAALRTWRVLDNAERVVAIEALAAAQGLDLREPATAPGTGAARALVRTRSPRLREDRSLSRDVEVVREALAAGDVADAVTNVGIEIR